MKIPNLKIRPTLISLITLFIVPSVVFGVTRGHDYLTVRGLKIDAQRLADKGEYQEAIRRLSEVEGQWTTNKIRNENKENIKLYQELVESENYFDQARIFYNEGSYEEAIELFKKVLPADASYKSAQAWLVLAEKKLAEVEGKEQGSVAGVNTQSSDISKDFNQVIPSPAVNVNDAPKLEIIKGLFFKIGELNARLISYGLLLQDAANSYKCDRYEIAKQFKTPSAQEAAIRQCEEGRNSILGGYSAEIESMKRQIRDYNRQILDIMATCQTNECANFYQEVVRTLEAEGYLVR